MFMISNLVKFDVLKHNTILELRPFWYEVQEQSYHFLMRTVDYLYIDK